MQHRDEIRDMLLFHYIISHIIKHIAIIQNKTIKYIISNKYKYI